MKNRVYRKWGVGLLLTVLPLAGGCLQENPNASAPQPASSNVIAATAVTTNATKSEGDLVAAGALPETDITEAPVKAVATEKRFPLSVRTNGPVADIIKLADSGVDEKVLLAYVTNSASMFSLTADEIIYLNDVGVPGTVVTAMLQHDQEIKGAAAEAAAAAAQAAATTQPTPAEMAPQPENPPPAPTQTEAAPPVESAPATVPTESTFYQGLSPYGTWVDVDGYGLCWQPTVVVVNPTWRPYFDSGHWVYSNCGWYWASDYSWGWAPFHYGRWFNHHRLGWCWYPGYTWGPSWVTWRYTDGYCGWAPLPPCAVYTGFGLTYWGAHVGVGFTFGLGFNCYSFVSWNHFHHHHLEHYGIPSEHARRVYHDSVAATRIVGNRDRAFNHGITPERVATATHTPVQRVTLRETSNLNGRSLRPDHLSADGKSMTVYRPRLGNPETTRLAKPEPVSSARTPIVRRTSPETAPAGALKPVPTLAPATRPTASDSRVASREPSRPVPATALADVQSTSRTRSEATRVTSRPPAESAVPNTQSRQGVRSSFQSRSGNMTSSATSQTASQAGTPTTTARVERRAPTAAAPSSSPAASNSRANNNLTYNWQRPSPTAPTPSRSQSSARAPASQSSSQYAPAPVRSEVPRSMPSQSPYQYRAPSSQAQSAMPRYNTAPAPSYQAPTYTAPSRSVPSPSYQPAPSYTPPQRTYSAPQQQSYSAPAPSYSAPQRSYSAPAQSYSAPPSAPSPSYSAPQRSSSSGDSSSGSSSRGSSRPTR